MSEIRKATSEDLTEVYNLIVELENQSFDVCSFSKIYNENLDNKRVHYYVYEIEHKIIGFISIHIQSLLHHASNIAEIQELIITDSMRGKGLGKMLFEKALDIAKEDKCSKIEVCCNQKRKASHEFYTEMGMENNHYKFIMDL